jgi:hypothetical protein
MRIFLIALVLFVSGCETIKIAHKRAVGEPVTAEEQQKSEHEMLILNSLSETFLSIGGPIGVAVGGVMSGLSFLLYRIGRRKGLEDLIVPIQESKILEDKAVGEQLLSKMTPGIQKRFKTVKNKPEKPKT